MKYKITITNIETEARESFETVALPMINYCNGYLTVTSMLGVRRVGSNFSIDIEYVKEQNDTAN